MRSKSSNYWCNEITLFDYRRLGEPKSWSWWRCRDSQTTNVSRRRWPKIRPLVNIHSQHVFRRDCDSTHSTDRSELGTLSPSLTQSERNSLTTSIRICQSPYVHSLRRIFRVCDCIWKTLHECDRTIINMYKCKPCVCEVRENDVAVIWQIILIWNIIFHTELCRHWKTYFCFIKLFYQCTLGLARKYDLHLQIFINPIMKMFSC